MKKAALYMVLGIALGIFISAAFVVRKSADLMILEDESKYGFEETISRIEDSALAMDWKIPVKHDLKNSLEKFGYDVEAVTVIELCKPEFANEILVSDSERLVSTMMPCRLAVYKKTNGKTYVSRMNSKMMASLMGDKVKEVMGGAFKENEEMVLSVLRE